MINNIIKENPIFSLKSNDRPYVIVLLPFVLSYILFVTEMKNIEQALPSAIVI